MPPRSRSSSPDGAAKLLTRTIDDVDAFRAPSPKDRKGKGRDDTPADAPPKKDPLTVYSDDSDALNKYLRTVNKKDYSEADRKRFNDLTKDVSERLEELPKHDGRTYRGAPGGEWVDKLKKGDFYNDHAFMSSSTSERTAERFKAIATGAFGGERKDGVMVTIDGKSGRDITDQSSLSHQKEVLFNRGSLFRVQDKTKDGDTTYLHLVEL
ncbi:hypothetical protein GCM10009830_05430 [Glycomyces endophyticus]|uniref:ADP ribosyltransferase domain-containing protein n=1 Tax=Glycomyces endophyticus TaxID=480996 RepID=A0ABN2G028_9ACTN